jgi:hypothetical protein
MGQDLHTLIAEQQDAVNAQAARELPALQANLAAEALIPMPRRLEAAYAIEDAVQATATGDADLFADDEPRACFYCGTFANVTVHKPISGEYPVCDDDLEQHQRFHGEAAAFAAE